MAYFFLGCFLLFFGLMRCESYNANKFNIMCHVCSLLVMPESPLNFKLQQERIKTCNSKLNSFLIQEIIQRMLEMPCMPSRHNHPTRPETGKNGKTYQNRTLPKKEFFGGKWREYGRNKGKYDEIWKVRKITTGKSQVEYHVGFPKGRNYSRGIGDTLRFSKTKVSSSQKTPSSPRSWEKSVQKPIKPKASHREFFGGKWREYGRKRENHERLGKPL